MKTTPKPTAARLFLVAPNGVCTVALVLPGTTPFRAALTAAELLAVIV